MELCYKCKEMAVLEVLQRGLLLYGIGSPQTIPELKKSYKRESGMISYKIAAQTSLQGNQKSLFSATLFNKPTATSTEVCFLRVTFILYIKRVDYEMLAKSKERGRIASCQSYKSKQKNIHFQRSYNCILFIFTHEFLILLYYCQCMASSFYQITYECVINCPHT